MPHQNVVNAKELIADHALSMAEADICKQLSGCYVSLARVHASTAGTSQADVRMFHFKSEKYGRDADGAARLAAQLLLLVIGMAKDGVASSEDMSAEQWKAVESGMRKGDGL